MSASDSGVTPAAVVHVASKAAAAEPEALARLGTQGVTASRVAQAISSLRDRGRVTLNFHPDRRDSKGRTVAAGLLADGRYLPQSETGISNGQRFPARDGARSQWEMDLFGLAYAGAEQSTRPVYGALDLFRDPYGGAPRFGSCFVVLKAHCLDRATLCVGDSHVGPTDVGTASSLTSVLAGAVEGCLLGDGFGRGLAVETFLDTLTSPVEAKPSARELDRYIEAQVHGGIDLARDVAQIVLDPSFRGSTIERDIVKAASRYGFEVGWNEGSVMDPAAIDPGFRGPAMVDLARRTIRHDGLVDAAAIGKALDAMPYTAPPLAGDPEDSPRQRYKKLWHCCLRFGRPQLDP